MFKKKSYNGILIYICGMFVTSLLNIFVKSAIVKFNLPTVEVLCVRQFFIVLFLIPLMVKRRFNFFDKTSFKPNVARNILFSITTFLLYIGMSRIPLNNATAITFLTPIIGSFLAVKLLKEKASRGIIISFILAIIGMLIIQQPSFDDKNLLLGYICLFFAVIGRSYIVILNKRLATKFDTFTMLFYTHIVMFSLYVLFFPMFVRIPLEAFKYILGASVLFFIEYSLIFSAYKLAKASVLQPFDFSKLLFVIIFSDLLLNESPQFNQIIGSTIIVSGYILMLFLNRKQNNN